MSSVSCKCTLVPREFFDPGTARDSLGSVVLLDKDEKVEYMEVPQYDAVLIYTDDNIPEGETPEMFRVLQALSSITEHNRIVALWKDSSLLLAIAQGDRLSYANVFRVTAAETVLYYITLVMKSLQLNPAVSTIYLKDCTDEAFVRSLYRYFDSVGRI